MGNVNVNRSGVGDFIERDTMTIEDLNRLEKLLKYATQGEWKWFDGCSWRRLGTVEGRDDCVICPTNHPHDGHPDLNVNEFDMAAIETLHNLAPALIAAARKGLESEVQRVISDEEFDRGCLAMGIDPDRVRASSGCRRLSDIEAERAKFLPEIEP